MVSEFFGSNRKFLPASGTLYNDILLYLPLEALWFYLSHLWIVDPTGIICHTVQAKIFLCTCAIGPAPLGEKKLSFSASTALQGHCICMGLSLGFPFCFTVLSVFA